MRLSLSNRLALVFFAITLLAVGSLYLYVAPGLQSRLTGEKLTTLVATARTHADPLRRALGSSTPLPRIRRLVGETARSSGDRVTLLSVNRSQGATQLSRLADTGGPPATPARFDLAYRAVATRRLLSGTAATSAGLVAQAADPVPVDRGQVGGSSSTRRRWPT